MQLLARTRFFGSGHPLSGMDPNALGAVYRGRAEFRTPAALSAKTAAERRASRSRGEAERRQTIAERKQAELANAAGSGKQSKPDKGGEL
jgi:preprotein translocase subunit SecD